jgi:hypothetical protein
MQSQPSPIVPSVSAAPSAAEKAESPRENSVLLRPAATCPRCGSRPALRLTGSLVAALQAQPAERRMATYQCQRRGCGAVYDLPAAAFRSAR